jgi:hypothetical protein
MNVITKFALVGAVALLALTGCVVDPGGGYDHRGYGGGGWEGRNHIESNADREPYRSWDR